MAQNAALITGVGREAGLGAAIARRLALDGWDLALSYWHLYDQRVNSGPGSNSTANGTKDAADRPGEVGALARELEAFGSRVILVEADLEDPQVPRTVVDRASGALGPLTGLVLSHAESVDSGILDTSLESFDRHFAVNVRASWQLIRGFALQCLDDGGAIVALTSDHTVGNLPYGASKGALDRIVLAAGRELGERNISSNALNPGPVDTGWMTDAVRSAGLQRQPTGRLGTPADVAGVVAFLLSGPGRWINGQLIKADGGFSV